MGDEMKQAETGMPSLTLEPELSMEAEKEFYQYFKINMGESSANYFQIEFWKYRYS